MSKNNFLLLSLDDEKAKDIASVVNSKAAKKILKFLGEKESSTETEISKKLNLPISTVHYNLEQLKKAKLIEWKKYHYSSKGKEVKHYSLTNKYIIIAPKNDNRFLEQLKGILPSFVFSIVGAGLIYKFNQTHQTTFVQSNMVAESADTMMAKAAPESMILDESVVEYSPSLIETIMNEPSLMFLSGALFAIIIYLVINYIKKYNFNKN